MRYLGVCIAIVAMGLALWGATLGIIGMFERSKAPKELLALVPEAAPSIVYRLEKERWTSFPIPPGQNPIKVLSNVGLPDGYRNVKLPDDQEWHYAIEFQVLDGSGKVLREGVYNHKTKLTKYRDEIKKRELVASFFLTPRVQPSDGRSMLINLEGMSNPKKLRMRLAEIGPEIQGLFVRVYGPQQNPEFKLRSIWQRMTDRQKTRLAGGNVYPKELMSDSEKQNIAAATWMPVGPSGVQRRDYQPHEIHVLIENEAEPINPVGPQAGLQLDRFHAAVIPLGEQGGDISLRFSPLDGMPNGKGSITVKWFGRGVLQRQSRSIKWDGVPTVFAGRYMGGMLEVLANQPLVVRAFRKDAKVQQEITPEPFYLRTYQLESGVPFDYSIEHEEGRPTPFKLDVRRFVVYGTPSRPELTARYQLLDAERKTLGGGVLKVPFEPSPYESIAGMVPAPVISMAVPFHFLLSKNVRYMRIISGEPILLAAYNRPYDLPHRVSVPEDYYRTYEQQERQAAWFPLYHPDHDRLLLKNGTVLLTTQINPPIDDPELVAGRYQWEDFRPIHKDWVARRLLTDWDPAIPFHIDALPSLYRPLPNGVATSMSLQAETGVDMVEPVVLYQQQRGVSGQVRIAVDGKPVYQGIVSDTVGEIRLLPLKVGRHLISVQGPQGSRFAINQSGPAPDSILVRLGNRFKGDTISFEVEKSRPEEMLSLRYYAPLIRKGGTVRLRILCEPVSRPGGPWNAWTFRERHFSIRLDGKQEVQSMGSSAERLIGGESMYLPLGDDMPKGRYRFRVVNDRSSEGYLSFSRTIPGVVNKRVKVQQEEVRHVEQSE